MIGEVWADPDQPADTPVRNRRWFCAIEEYEPFNAPVAAKQAGKSYENIRTAMGWRTGVREITFQVFTQIVDIGGAARRASSWHHSEISLDISSTPLLLGTPCNTK